MTKSRLEAFSDGVIAIIITIMVLELHAPHGNEPAALLPLVPAILGYALSFLFVGIYWNNHHHTLQAVHEVDGKVLWANMHLLFWLSLIPFGTAWLGETGFASWPLAFYGFDLLMAAFAYALLVRALIAAHPKNGLLAKAVGADFKGKISLALYALAIPSGFWVRWLGLGIYVFVALIWLVPDRRIERVLRR